MNNLIMQLRIEHSKLKKEFDELNLKLTRLLNELIFKANPYFDNLEEIDAEAIEQIGDEILETKKRAVEVLEKLRKVERDLK